MNALINYASWIVNYASTSISRETLHGLGWLGPQLGSWDSRLLSEGDDHGAWELLPQEQHASRGSSLASPPDVLENFNTALRNSLED